MYTVIAKRVELKKANPTTGPHWISIINQKADPSTNGRRIAPTIDPTAAGLAGPAAPLDELSGSALDEADEEEDDDEDDACVAASADGSATSAFLGAVVGAVRMLLGMLVWVNAAPVATRLGLMLMMTLGSEVEDDGFGSDEEDCGLECSGLVDESYMIVQTSSPPPRV